MADVRGFPLQQGGFSWLKSGLSKFDKNHRISMQVMAPSKSMNITTLSPIIHGSVENGIVIEKVRIL